MDELLAKIEGWLIEYGQHDRKFKLGDTIKYTPSEVTNILRKKMSNLDIAPIKHGYWIDIDEQLYTWKVRCSCCNHERSMMSTQGTYPNYCENCGARIVKDE